jgi:hypothetical protein
MAGALIQHRTVSFGAVGSVALAFSSPVGLGRRVIVGVSVFPSTITVASVTDNGTTPNTYNDDNANQSQASVGTLNTRSANVATNPGAGNLQVTVTFSGTATGGDLYIQEVSGESTAANAVDTSGTKQDLAGTATALSCTSASSAGAPGEYVFGVFAVSGTPGSWAAGSGTTLDDSDVTNGSAACHRTNNSAGTGQETVNLTISNGNSYLGQVTLYTLVAVPAGANAGPEGRRPASLRVWRQIHRRRATNFDPAPVPDAPPAASIPRELVALNAVRRGSYTPR